MIPVRLCESDRTYEVRLGLKSIGKVHVYSDSGRAAAYHYSMEWLDGVFKRKEEYLATDATLRAATNLVLRSEGVGNTREIQITHASAGKK